MTRGNKRRHLVGLFNFALRNQYTRNNPAVPLPTPRVHLDKRPTIFTVPEVRGLMRAAVDRKPEMIPYFALCLFAGLRPDSEAQHMNWADIDLDRGELYVSNSISKTGTERYVALQPNLIEWLLPFHQEEAKVFFSRWFFVKIREQSELCWAHDITRHSYGSYHLGAFRNAGDTAEQMGHLSSTSMLFRHYRRAVRQDDAEEYWKIRPELTSEVMN